MADAAKLIIDLTGGSSPSQGGPDTIPIPRRPRSSARDENEEIAELIRQMRSDEKLLTQAKIKELGGDTGGAALDRAEVEARQHERQGGEGLVKAEEIRSAAAIVAGDAAVAAAAAAAVDRMQRQDKKEYEAAESAADKARADAVKEANRRQMELKEEYEKAESAAEKERARLVAEGNRRQMELKKETEEAEEAAEKERKEAAAGRKEKIRKIHSAGQEARGIIGDVGGIGADIAQNRNLSAARGVVELAAKGLDKLGPAGAAAAEALRTASAAVGAFAEVTNAFVARGRELSIYNQGLAQAAAQADIRSMQADIREADVLGPKLAQLIEQQSELENTVREIMLPLKEFIIDILSEGMRTVKDILEAGLNIAKHMPGLGDWAQAALDKLNRDKSADINRMMKDFLGVVDKLGPIQQRPDMDAHRAAQRLGKSVLDFSGGGAGIGGDYGGGNF